MLEFFIASRERYSSKEEAQALLLECFPQAFPSMEDLSIHPPIYSQSITEALEMLEELDKKALYPDEEPDQEKGWERVSLREEAYLYILPGIYLEHPCICRPNVKLLGAGPDRVFLLGARGGRDAYSDSPKRGTFRSQTVFVHTRKASIENLTIANLAGQGSEAGQAIALYADGDELTFSRLRLIGRQDTLFCGPLPPKEVEKGGFIGPLQMAPRINGRALFTDCHIEGTIDFIFGSGTAYFENCDILSVDPRGEGAKDEKALKEGQEAGEKLGFVTAPSTPEGQDYGFVFSKCRLRGECPKETIYLGRPWRDYGQSVFLECEIQGHINPLGWDDWEKPLARQRCFFAEYGCTGEGARLDRRADFAKRLSASEAERFSREKVLGF